MRMQIVSDLHLEFGNPVPDLAAGVDVVVLAGDLAEIRHPWLLAEAVQAWEGAEHILYVPGNHEYYGSDIDEGRQILAGQCRIHGVTLLDLEHGRGVEAVPVLRLGSHPSFFYPSGGDSVEKACMNWVKLKAYRDGGFALNAILDRFEADVDEANALPESIRGLRTFHVHRDGPSAVVRRDSGDDGIRTMLTLQAEADHVFCTAPDKIGAQIRAVPCDSGEVNWALGDGEPIPLWELSRELLGRYVFEF